MRGSKIPSQYHYSSIGEVMALSVSNFIVALRGDDDISSLDDRIDNRLITGVIENQATKYISSSVVKSIINKQNLSSYVSNEVISIIEKYSLYHGCYRSNEAI